MDEVVSMSYQLRNIGNFISYLYKKNFITEGLFNAEDLLKIASDSAAIVYLAKNKLIEKDVSVDDFISIYDRTDDKSSLLEGLIAHNAFQNALNHKQAIHLLQGLKSTKRKNGIQSMINNDLLLGGMSVDDAIELMGDIEPFRTRVLRWFLNPKNPIIKTPISNQDDVVKLVRDRDLVLHLTKNKLIDGVLDIENTITIIKNIFNKRRAGYAIASLANHGHIPKNITHEQAISLLHRSNGSSRYNAIGSLVDNGILSNNMDVGVAVKLLGRMDVFRDDAVLKHLLRPENPIIKIPLDNADDITRLVHDNEGFYHLMNNGMIDKNISFEDLIRVVGRISNKNYSGYVVASLIKNDYIPKKISAEQAIKLLGTSRYSSRKDAIKSMADNDILEKGISVNHAVKLAGRMWTKEDRIFVFKKLLDPKNPIIKTPIYARDIVMLTQNKKYLKKLIDKNKIKIKNIESDTAVNLWMVGSDKSPIIFAIDGDKLSGIYFNQKSAIYNGSFNDNVFDGYFYYHDKKGSCKKRKFEGKDSDRWGRFKMYFSDKSFKATWNSCKDDIGSEKESWIGKKF